MFFLSCSNESWQMDFKSFFWGGRGGRKQGDNNFVAETALKLASFVIFTKVCFNLPLKRKLILCSLVADIYLIFFTCSCVKCSTEEFFCHVKRYNFTLWLPVKVLRFQISTQFTKLASFLTVFFTPTLITLWLCNYIIVKRKINIK